MKITRYALAAAIGLLGFVAPSALRADSVVYSNFGPGDTFNSLGAWGVQGANVGNDAIAASFTGTGVSLAEVDLPLVDVRGTNSVVIDLLGDNGGVPSISNLLEQWTVNNTTTTSQIFDLASTSNPFLASGTPYWLAVLPGASDTVVGWDFNSTGVNGLDESTAAGTGWISLTGSTTPAFEVLGTSAVPEPSSLLLLSTGLLGFAAAARRKLRPWATRLRLAGTSSFGSRPSTAAPRP